METIREIIINAALGALVLAFILSGCVQASASNPSPSTPPSSSSS